MDCCVVDPRNPLGEAALFERAKAAHQDGAEPPALTAQTSRFRKLPSTKWWTRLLLFARGAGDDDPASTESGDSTSYA
jgi:hypothetical protein